VRSRLATTASERDAALDAAQIAAEDADGLRLELERTRDELLRVNGGYLPARLLTSYPPPSVGGAAVRGLGGSASGLGGSVLGGSMLGSSGGSGLGMPWRTPEGIATDEAAAMPRVLSAQESLSPVTIEAAQPQPQPPQPIAPPKKQPEGPAYWGGGVGGRGEAGVGGEAPKTAPTPPDSSPHISISSNLVGAAPTPGHRAAPPPPQHRKPPPPPPTTQSIRAASVAAPPQPPAAPTDAPPALPTTAPEPPKSEPTTAPVEAKPEPAGQAPVVAEGEFSFEDMVRQSGGAVPPPKTTPFTGGAVPLAAGARRAPATAHDEAFDLDDGKEHPASDPQANSAGTMHAPAMGIKRKGAGKRAVVDPLA